MKIIRIVHESDPEKLEVEKNVLAIQNYARDNFLETHGKQILEYAYSNLATRFMLGVIESSEDEAEIKDAVYPAVIFAVDSLLNDLRGISEEVEILPFQLAQVRYPETQNLAIGTYTIHPRNGKMLTRLEHYHQNLALEKDDELIMLLGQMGAKEVTIIENERQTWAASGKVAAEKMVISGGIGTNISQHIEKGKTLKVIFEGIAVSLDPDLLKKSLWFSTDGKLEAIFQSLKGNRMLRYELTYTHGETFDFDFDLAAKYLMFKADLRAEYQSLSYKERTFIVDFPLEKFKEI